MKWMEFAAPISLLPTATAGQVKYFQNGSKFLSEMFLVQAKRNLKAEVTKTRAANVSRPKGAPLGLVTVTKDDVVTAWPQQSIAAQNENL